MIEEVGARRRLRETRTPEQSHELLMQVKESSAKKGIMFEKLSLKGCEIQFATEGLGPSEWWIQYLKISSPTDSHNLVQILGTLLDEEGQLGITSVGVGKFFFLSRNDPEGSEPEEMKDYVAVFVTTPLSNLSKVRSRLQELEDGFRKTENK